MEPNPPPSTELLGRDGLPVSVKPTWQFALSHPAHAIALAFGAGLSPLAPGTVGTLWAWLSFALLQPHLNDRQWASLIVGGLILGVWASRTTAQRLGVADPGCIVWDEVVAFWLVLWLAAPVGGWTQAVAFVLFRFFDAAKPGPVAWADQQFKGFGWRGAFGIMWDDLVAAFCTLFLLALWRAW